MAPPQQSFAKTTSANSRRYDINRKFTFQNVPFHPTVVRTSLPPGWKKYVHPEGNPYYHHEQRHLLTESIIENSWVAKSIDAWYRRFRDMAGDVISECWEIVLHLDNDQGGCTYYIIDHDNRKELWLDTTDTKTLGMGMSYNEQHLDLKLQEHYWIHFEYFPMHRSLPQNAENQLVALLCHAITDQLTSEESTAPYTATECERFLNVIGSFRGDCGEKRLVIARLYRVFTHSQFINLYGQEGARLARTQSIADEAAGSPSACLDALSYLLLFGFPQFHAKCLNSLWVDRVIYIEHWDKYVRTLEREWTQSVVVAGFFLLLDVIIIVADPPSDDALRVTTVISSLFSLTSIVSGVLHIRRLQSNATDNAQRAGAFLERAYHATLGNQPLSILNSVPAATMLWGIAAFSTTLLRHAHGVFADGLPTQS